MHPWFYGFLGQLPIKSNWVNFDGFGGDRLLRGARQIAKEGRPIDSDDIDMILKAFRVNDPDKILPPASCKEVYSRVRASLSAELKRYNRHSRIVEFSLQNRGRFGVSHALRMQRRRMGVATPFLDDRLISAILSIPREIRLHPSFYPKLIESIEPGLAGLPSTNSVADKPSRPKRPLAKFSQQAISWRLEKVAAAKKLAKKDDPFLADGIMRRVEEGLGKSESAIRRRAVKYLDFVGLYSSWLTRYADRMSHFPGESDITASERALE
jgi:hypothetical protein